MNLEYKKLVPQEFDNGSRVWIYQANRLFTMSEALQIEDLLNEFTANWQSHGVPVKGWATLFFGQFVIMMADETATGVSGCSTDSSVRVLKEIERRFSVNMFDRQMLAFVPKEKVELLPITQLTYAVENQFVSPDTPYFNNTVQTKEELLNNWIIPLRESWVGKRLKVKG